MSASSKIDPAPAAPPRRRSPAPLRPVLPGALFADVMNDRPQGGRLRAVRRLGTAVLWTLLAMPVQALLLLLPDPAPGSALRTWLGRGKVRFARFYWRTMCRLIGLELRVIGTPAPGGRVLTLANHSSWLDILVLGGTVEACFVAKAEIARWPLVGWIARLGRTVFVSRARGRTGTEADAMRERLAAGDGIVLFPEGTSSDGTRILPFRSSFLAVADGAAAVQPVTLSYDRLGGLPVSRRDRAVFAWYGDMDVGSHAWRLTRRSGLRVTVLLHEPIPAGAFADRKALTRAAEAAVSTASAALRQNRPVEPTPR